jgi:hypothetical protein
MIDNESLMCFFAGMALVAGLIFIISLFFPLVQISQQSLDEVCIKLTNNTNAVWVQDNSGDSKFICETPSFDSTSNIIIRNEELYLRRRC